MSALQSKPRVLIVSRWKEVVAIARLPMALSQAGFSVAAMCTDDSFLAKTRFVDARFTCPRNERRLLLAFLKVFRAWKPDLIVPGNDWDLAFLQRLASSSLARKSRIVSPSLSDVLRRSLGDPTFFDKVGSKRGLQDLAVRLGIRTPDYRVISRRESAFAHADELGYPVVLKHDFNSGGSGVWICRDEHELTNALKLADESSKRRSLKRAVKDVINHVLFVPPRSGTGVLSIQQFIRGNTVLHNFVALDGQKVAGVTAENLYKYPVPTGPSSVVRPVRNDEIDQAASAIVAHAGFSGFGCFDFIVEDETELPYLLECNAIPTNVAHVGRRLGTDLCANLYAKLTGSTCVDVADEDVGPVALFPQELRRDPRSPNASRYFHDVPSEDPELLDAYASHFKLPVDRTSNRR